MSNLPIYSPSQTEKWSTCPILWEYEYRQRWTKRDIGNKEIAMLLGRAFGRGMEYYNRAWSVAPDQRKNPAMWIDASLCSIASYKDGLEHLQADGFNLEALADKGDIAAALSESVLSACKHDPTPLEWSVVAVEEPRPEWGWARADVVYVLPDGSRVVRDYKFKLKLDTKYLAKEQDRYGRAAQVPHYLLMENATTFIVTIVRYHPFKVFESPVYMSKERLAQWHASQQVKWDLMEGHSNGALPLWEADTHQTQFGDCPLLEFCLTHGRNPDVLPVLGFVQRRKGD